MLRACGGGGGKNRCQGLTATPEPRCSLYRRAHPPPFLSRPLNTHKDLAGAWAKSAASRALTLAAAAEAGGAEGAAGPGARQGVGGLPTKTNSHDITKELDGTG